MRWRPLRPHSACSHLPPHIQLAAPHHLDWVRQNASAIGGPQIIAGGTRYDLTEGTVFVGIEGRQTTGFASVVIAQDSAVLTGILSATKQRGTGTALLQAVEHHCQDAGCDVLRVHTTNDNLDALRFYQRRGFRLRNVDSGGFNKIAHEKGLPTSLTGYYGIPIRDELLLEKSLRKGKPS